MVNMETLLNQKEAAISFDQLECTLRVEGRSLTAKGKLMDDGWVECQARAFSYSAQKPTIDAELYLSAGGNFVIDKTTGTARSC